MNDLLISEISEQQEDLLRTFSLIEENIFGTRQSYKKLLDKIIADCQLQIEGIDDQLDQAEQFINALYVDHLLLDTKKSRWPIAAFKMAEGLNQRLIYPVLKAALIREIASQIGFDADLVFVPEKIMVRLVCNENYAIIFDPLNGESINFLELDERMEELCDDPQDYHLASVDVTTILIDYLTACKNELIAQNEFDTALACVDLLVSLRPEDPFERRDRGFLLHQLDCFKVAYDDYRFFVEHCPKDPAAQLLKIQLDNIKITNTVVH